jgi:hypothetical protein
LDRAEWLRARGLMEDRHLRGDIRTDHVLRISPRAALLANTWFGTLDGGEFETPFLYVMLHDGQRMRASDSFDLDQLDAALARYEELSREPSHPTEEQPSD